MWREKSELKSWQSTGVQKYLWKEGMGGGIEERGGDRGKEREEKGWRERAG